MKNRYQTILKQYPELYHIVEQFPNGDAFQLIATNVVAPVLVMYTKWILLQAEKHHIKRLYFLARDGYLMVHIARTLCKSSQVKFSYFYCSRYALRMAAYRFYDETAFEKLFIHAYHQNLYYLLKRAGFTEEQREAVYQDIGYYKNKERDPLGKREFDELCGKLKKSSIFLRYLTENSDRAYAETMAYIRQEEMLKYDRIGIVDLGWTGSLQQTLKRLLDSENSNIKIFGFYMGMLNQPPETHNSRYFTWLFQENDFFIKSWFSQNLMECLCSAPHGMTIGYKQEKNAIVPVFTEAENQGVFAKRLCRACTEMAVNCTFPYEDNQKRLALKLLKKIMFSPTEQECKALEKYRFCDDVGEQYHQSIVQDGKIKDFNQELLFYKLFFRDNPTGFYWYYGSVQSSNRIPKMLYRWTYLVTKYLIAKMKSR